MMDESTFLALAERELSLLESLIEQAADDHGIDIDIEPQAGGILQLEFADGSKIIINRHTAAREIWVAARSGGFHFRHDGQDWVGTRDGQQLHPALSALISSQSGQVISLP